MVSTPMQVVVPITVPLYIKTGDEYIEVAQITADIMVEVSTFER